MACFDRNRVGPGPVVLSAGGLGLGQVGAQSTMLAPILLNSAAAARRGRLDGLDAIAGLVHPHDGHGAEPFYG
jgi:hypothetical protein